MWKGNSMAEIEIGDLDKADVLAALYNTAKMQGRGVLDPGGSMQMTREQAAERIARSGLDFGYPGYVNGRVLKVDLSGDTFDAWLYDRDNGEGKAARVIANLRENESVAEII